MRNNYDLFIGKKYGKLTVTEILPNITNRNRKCIAVCDCGGIKEFELNNLRRGQTRSCGCIHVGFTRHGLSRTKIYQVYTGIMQRCYNEKQWNYKSYGGRGIRMCDEWLNDVRSFYDWAIANGHKKGLQIDRINNNGNYEPTNCRFVTPKKNQNNRRNNRVVEYNGIKKTLTEWSELLNVDMKLLSGRLSKGWTVKETMEKPLRVWPKNKTA